MDPAHWVARSSGPFDGCVPRRMACGRRRRGPHRIRRRPSGNPDSVFWAVDRARSPRRERNADSDRRRARRAFGSVRWLRRGTSIRLGEGSSLEVRTAERSYSAVLPPDSEECLMHEELSILGRDPVFDRVLGDVNVNHDLRQFPDAEAAAEACAQQILDWLREAIETGRWRRWRFPEARRRAGCSRSSRTAFEWERVHLFWVDERAVPQPTRRAILSSPKTPG